MVPSFKSKELRDICESADKATEVLGKEQAEALKIFLADLHAATNIHGLPNHEPEILGDQCKFSASPKLYVLLTSNHPQNPVTKANPEEWVRVNRIKIIEIGQFT